jgi:hypothetical protein
LVFSCISAIRLGSFRFSTAEERYRMVQILRRGSVAVFRVFDQDGRAIGEVVQPKSAPVVGLGARTVLLVRGEEETAYSPPKTFC